MIKSYAHGGLRRFAERGDPSKLPERNAARVRRVLLVLESASRPEDANVPGFRFHALRGDRAGTYSVTVSANWRVTFRWDDGAADVNIEDYH